MTLFMRRAVAKTVHGKRHPPWCWCRTTSKKRFILPTMCWLLSRHPARVADFPAVTAVRPRTDATLSDTEFVRTKAHCLEVFQREVRRA